MFFIEIHLKLDQRQSTKSLARYEPKGTVQPFVQLPVYCWQRTIYTHYISITVWGGSNDRQELTT